MMRISASIAIAALALAAPSAQPSEIARYPLPSEITFPEGIAHDPRTNAVYTGSAETWAVARLALDTRQTAIVSPGGKFPTEPFPALLGMRFDQAGRLWLSGGRTGLMAVLDARTGKELARFEVPTRDKSLINDVVVVASGAYYTDTFVPTLWRIPLHGDHIGELEPWLDLANTPIQYEKGPNLNGIAATADGRHLIVVQMNKGLLFRIAIDTREVTPIDTAGEALSTGDGLVLDGRTLYVVRQGEEEIVTLELSEDLARGRVTNRFKDPALAWPATAAKVGNQLLVVNTQFNRRQAKQAETPFTIVGIPLSRLAGKPVARSQ